MSQVGWPAANSRHGPSALLRDNEFSGEASLLHGEDTRHGQRERGRLLRAARQPAWAQSAPITHHSGHLLSQQAFKYSGQGWVSVTRRDLRKATAPLETASGGASATFPCCKLNTILKTRSAKKGSIQNSKHSGFNCQGYSRARVHFQPLLSASGAAAAGQDRHPSLFSNLLPRALVEEVARARRPCWICSSRSASSPTNQPTSVGRHRTNGSCSESPGRDSARSERCTDLLVPVSAPPVCSQGRV